MNELLPSLNLTSPAQWTNQREKWVALAEDCLYGHAPIHAPSRGESLAHEAVWEGQATRETVRIHYGPGEQYSFLATLLRPAEAGMHPVILWNQFTQDDPNPMAYNAVVERGYCLAMFVRTQLVEDEEPGSRDAYVAYPECDWGAVRVWAWGHQLLADYLTTRTDIDPARMACTGFSRGGKAALAAGILDERFRVCAPINAGAGGCGCFRWLGDREGLNQDVTKEECLGRVGSVFPQWWTKGFLRYWNPESPISLWGEDRLPFDSHTLKALIAPRNLISTEGIDDAWSNPFGTWLTWKAAQPAFTLLGGRNDIFYHPGGHAFGQEDWQAVLDFCDEVFFGRVTGTAWNQPPFSD